MKRWANCSPKSRSPASFCRVPCRISRVARGGDGERNRRSRRLTLTSTTLDGPDFNLEAYRGLAVWIVEQPEIVRLAAKYHDNGLRVIGMFDSFEDTDDAVVRKYRRIYDIGYPLIRDKVGLVRAVRPTDTSIASTSVRSRPTKCRSTFCE